MIHQFRNLMILQFLASLASLYKSFGLLVLQLALKPCCIFFFQHRYPWAHGVGGVAAVALCFNWPSWAKKRRKDIAALPLKLNRWSCADQHTQYTASDMKKHQATKTCSDAFSCISTPGSEGTTSKSEGAQTCKARHVVWYWHFTGYALQVLQGLSWFAPLASMLIPNDANSALRSFSAFTPSTYLAQQKDSWNGETKLNPSKFFEHPWSH